MATCRLLLAAALVATALPVHALTGEELYARLAPSIWFVYGIDGSEKRVSQGSGVVIGPQRVITNCHVIRGASTVFLRKENVLYIARVEHRDPKRDLCQLQVSNLNAPAVEIGSSRELKVGQKVYALGNPQGLEVSLSDGLVSALRGPDGKDAIIQTTAPISSGSSGGGLFDQEGRLVGITTLQARSGQNLNFAVPAEWITELAERMKAEQEKKTAQVAALRNTAGVSYNPASPALPVPGSTWRYRHQDRMFSRDQVFVVRVTGVDGWVVQETLEPEGAGSSKTLRTSIGAEELRFLARQLPSSRTLVEFAPYLSALDLREPFKVATPTGYPTDRNSADWEVSASIQRNVAVKLAAGELNAIRVELRGTRNLRGDMSTLIYELGRFEMIAWYSAETRRVVRVENRSWYGNSTPAADELVELLEFSGG